MRRPAIIAADIETGMLNEAFREEEGHHTLGESFGVPAQARVETAEAAALPVGSVVFVKHSAAARQEDPLYDSVGMILGHTEDAVNVLALSPKDGSAWATHNAYDQVTSEVDDAVAALQRIFDPEREFGAIAVMSRTTGGLLAVETASSGTLAEAGCDSHDRGQLDTTLNLSQLLDRYSYRPEQLRSDSRLFRRDNDGRIMALTPGETLPDQPDQTRRDQKSLLDRIQRLAGDSGSALKGVSEVRILNGIVEVAQTGAFRDPDSAVDDVSQAIGREAARIAG